MIPFHGQTFEAEGGKFIGPETHSQSWGSNTGLWDSEECSPTFLKLKPNCPGWVAQLVRGSS